MGENTNQSHIQQWISISNIKIFSDLNSKETIQVGN